MTTPKERAAKAIMLEIQGHDFGNELEDGNFIMTKGQLQLLTECCDKARDNALAAIAEPSEAMIEVIQEAMDEQKSAAYVWRAAHAAMMAEKDTGE